MSRFLLTRALMCVFMSKYVNQSFVFFLVLMLKLMSRYLYVNKITLAKGRVKKVNVSSYIEKYPVPRISQSVFEFTSLADLFNHHLNFSGKHSAMLQLMGEGCSYKYQPLSIAKYSFM